VKETRDNRLLRTVHVMNTIINGVKVSKPMDEWVNTERIVDEVVKDGVKETVSKSVESYEQKDHKVTTLEISQDIKDVIENGIKEIRTDYKNPNSYHHKWTIEGIIENGVKETQPLPAQDGNRDWGNYYHGKEDRTKPFNEYLDEAIRFGVKETYDDCSDNIARVEGIIRVGKKIDKDGI
jgi:hypothetical protein